MKVVAALPSPQTHLKNQEAEEGHILPPVTSIHQLFCFHADGRAR